MTLNEKIDKALQCAHELTILVADLRSPGATQKIETTMLLERAREIERVLGDLKDGIPE